MDISLDSLDLISQFAALQAALMLVTFGLVAAAESLCPRRPSVSGDASRELRNVGLGATSASVSYLMKMLAALSAAALTSALSWRPFGQFPLSPWLVAAGGILLIDALVYALHRAFHAVSWLWRLHKVHHSDPGFDGSTGFRHHPLEQAAQDGMLFVLLAALGIPPLALAAYGMLATAHNIFVHGNLYLPARIDHALRLAIVTPDMHRVHHSVRAAELNSNFGAVFPWWDRLLWTYRAELGDGQQKATLGLAELGQQSRLGFFELLRLPMRG